MDFELQCPIPISEYPVITMAHGSGGKLSHQLIDKLFSPLFGNPMLDMGHDGAVLDIPPGRTAFTTDSFVVKPVFFPGGNIGDLAVNGTVNDLSCCGAEPLYLSLGMIIEEGLAMEDLWRICLSIRDAAQVAGVKIVTGDTKVVERGHGDKIYINTSGIGMVPDDILIDPSSPAEGDLVLINGPVGDHGMAIMSAREGLAFETTIASDTAALNGLVAGILATTKRVSVIRDPTRGGIATTLNEIAGSARAGIVLDERSIPVSDPVRGACELLGLDPLYVANEGKILVIVPGDVAEEVLEAMRKHPFGEGSSIIGKVTGEHPGVVRMVTAIGSSRVVDMLAGNQLPRIC